MGAKILVEVMRRAGIDVEHLRLAQAGDRLETTGRTTVDISTLQRPEAWFVSCLHARQYLELPRLFRTLGVGLYAEDRKMSDPLIAIGGQVCNSPEPIAPFADVLALGDGEVTGVTLAQHLAKGRSKLDVMKDLIVERGFYVPFFQSPPTPFYRVETPRIGVVPTLTGEKDRRVTLEVARGCRSKCAFCSIGWAGGTYREAPTDEVLQVIEDNEGGKIGLFAPDYSDHREALTLDGAMARWGCKAGSRNSRLDRAMSHLLKGGTAREFAFGVEGTSERLRTAVGKPLRHQAIVDMMAMLDGKVRETKWYIILGLPGEKADDRDEFRRLLMDVRRVYRDRLVITPSHLQSTPHTPLQWAGVPYCDEAAAWVDSMRPRLLEDLHVGGVYTRLLNMRGAETHWHDQYLVRGDRRVSRYIEKMGAYRGIEKLVARGRWRSYVAKSGAPDPEDYAVAELDPDGVHPWSHVDVGADPEKVRGAWRHYKKHAMIGV